MEQKTKTAIALSLTLLSGLALLGWTHSTPVMAQEAVTLKHGAISATPAKMIMEGGASLAASGDHLYVLN